MANLNPLLNETPFLCYKNIIVYIHLNTNVVSCSLFSAVNCWKEVNLFYAALNLGMVYHAKLFGDSGVGKLLV